MSNIMTPIKLITVLIAAGLIIPALIGTFNYLGKSYHNATTPISVTQVKPGVSCALATTAQGVAMQCWKD